QVGDSRGEVVAGGPLRHHGGQRRGVGVIAGAAADEDVVAAVADELVGAPAADEQIAAAAADEQVVADTAHQYIVAITAFEPIVAIAAVQPGGNGDVVVHLDVVIAGKSLNDNAANRSVNAPAYLQVAQVLVLDLDP